MQRIFYAANPSPAAFWGSTFDEVLLVIQGRVDNWRVQRINSYNLYCSWAQSPVSIFDFNPLPYDYELKGEETETTQEWYKEQVRLLNEFDWNKLTKR